MTSTDSIQKFENSRHLFVGGGCFVRLKLGQVSDLRGGSSGRAKNDFWHGKLALLRPNIV